jgi:hypothetical protein
MRAFDAVEGISRSSPNHLRPIPGDGRRGGLLVLPPPASRMSVFLDLPAPSRSIRAEKFTTRRRSAVGFLNQVVILWLVQCSFHCRLKLFVAALVCPKTADPRHRWFRRRTSFLS